ncbi:MAG: TRAP transporter small permease [Burkholderiaceae bacterium]|nr:TRAP transporter small permease [Burkholderiaceae bacterium]
MDAGQQQREGGDGGAARRRPPWQVVADLASAAAEVVAGVVLVGAMILTCADIVGRMLGHPIPGTYEIVSFAGGFITGLALPATARAHGHVRVDLLVSTLSTAVASVLERVTRIAGIGVLMLMAWGMAIVGLDLEQYGEVSSVLALPLYPVAFGMAFAFLLTALVMTTMLLAPPVRRA